jgi:hypothetical protein
MTGGETGPFNWLKGIASKNLGFVDICEGLFNMLKFS